MSPLLKPDICTLDLNTMNSGGEVVINTPGNVRRMARGDQRGRREARDRAVRFRRHRPHARPPAPTARWRGPQLCSFVMGVRYGFQPSPETVLYARDLLPAGTPSSPRSASGAAPSRRRRNPTWPAAMSASGWRTPSISSAACWRRRTPRWWRRRGASWRISAGRSPTPREAREIIGLPTRLGRREARRLTARPGQETAL